MHCQCENQTCKENIALSKWISLLVLAENMNYWNFIFSLEILITLNLLWFKKYGISTDFLQLAPGYSGEKDQKKSKVDKSKAFDEEDDSEPIKIDKSNILLLGPTGSGKEH